MTEQKPRIFLCHAHEDKPRVMELYDKLKAAGYRPWLDKHDLLPGQDWRAEIRRIIRDPDTLVVICLSDNSITKRGTVQREIKWALDVREELPPGAIYLIPARLDDCQVPEELSDLHWVDLFEADGFEYLTRSVDFEIGKRGTPAEPEKVEQAPDLGIVPRPAPVAASPQPVEPELIRIPAGEFLMGSNPKKDKDTADHERPQHRLHLPDYTIAKTPVTNAQYLAFVQNTGHSRPEHWNGGTAPEGKKDHPVTFVSWRDAMVYCQWLAETTGKGYRLPSEAEWEKAARGADGRIHPWGNDPPDEERCNFTNNVKDTTPVGQYAPLGDSPYGCVDMSGNVWEWTRSELRDYPYDPEDGREDPRSSGPFALRGGSWLSNQRSTRVSCRLGTLPGNFFNFLGFRVCVVAQ